MDTKAGENNTPTKLEIERINTKLNRRKELIHKNLFEPEPLTPNIKTNHFPQQRMLKKNQH